MNGNDVELAAALTKAWLINPNTNVATEDVFAFLVVANEALVALRATVERSRRQKNKQEVFMPAVPIRKSLADPSVILSLIDGKPFRFLKRHLAGHGLTPDQYRQRYGLPPDYPIVAASYSRSKSEWMKRITAERSVSSGRQEQPASPPAAAEKKSRSKLSIAGAKSTARKAS